MNKKTIIFCCILVAVLFVAAAVGVYVLFSGKSSSAEPVRTSDELPASFRAIPSDAVMIVEFGQFRDFENAFFRKDFPPAVFSGGSFLPSLLADLPGRLKEKSGNGVAEELGRSALSVSLHYSGHNRISPLAVVASSDASLAALVAETAKEMNGNCVASSDGGTVLLTDSQVLMESALRHLDEGVSIVDNRDFASIAEASGKGVNLYVNHPSLGKLFSGCFNSDYLGYASFFQSYAFWSRYSLDASGDGMMDFTGIETHNMGSDEYSYVFDGLSARPVSMYSMTPYYASLAIAIPVQDCNELLANIDRYRDGNGDLDKARARRQDLAKACGISPEEWIKSLSVKEIGIVRFESAGKQEFVNMVKCSAPEMFSLPDTMYADKVYSVRSREYPYKGFLASLFGKAFSFSNEEYSAFMSGWMVIGSKNAVNDYVSGRALELDLARYMLDAGISGAFPSKSLLSVMVNVSEDPKGISSPFRKDIAGGLVRSAEEHTIDMWTYSLTYKKGDVVPVVSIRTSDYEIPVVSKYERDTVVEIPKGPWRVKNSGTGRMNLMYQQDNMFLCLTEENGKGIWSAPFSSPICGNIDQVDYFENGKLQMIFASGSKLYLIDRLGRMVRPFPVDLGKPVLLGPKIYDFNQNRKYSAMVLHTDNTLGLYDMQGKPLETWKGFETDETIKALPELLEVNSALYWVVTTSRQTVICDFTGRPVADFSGSMMLRPGVEIKRSAADKVEVETYDGKVWVLDLKSGVFSKR